MCHVYDSKLIIMEKTMTPEESLQIIQKTITHSRKNMREGSFYYVLWGWALILGALSNYAVLEYYIRKQVYVGLWWKSILTWIIFISFAFVVQLVKSSRSTRNNVVKTHLDRYISTLWLCSGVIMSLMVFLSFKVGTYPTPFIMAITALATTVSGMMVRYTPLIVGGLVFLAASIVAMYVQRTEQLLVFAAAMVLGYLIPGYMLRSIKNGEDV